MEKVYTFFETIENWNSDKKLLDLWVKNWSEAGFETIVLTHKDAQANPYYDTFVNNVSNGFKTITGENIINHNNPWSFYVFYNYIRFLGYANIKSDEPILIMDYDIYNINYKKHEFFPKNIVFQCTNNPCLVSGTPFNFQLYCELMSENIISFNSNFKILFEESPYTTFHEMCFLHCLYYTGQQRYPEMKKILLESNFKFINVTDSILNDKNLIHISNEYLLNNYCQKTLIDMNKLTSDEKIELRYALAINKIYDTK